MVFSDFYFLFQIRSTDDSPLSLNNFVLDWIGKAAQGVVNSILVPFLSKEKIFVELKCSSLFQLHIFVTLDFLHILQPKNNISQQTERKRRYKNLVVFCHVRQKEI